MRRILKHINTIAAQSQVDAERYISIGADPDHVQISGNIKFDFAIPATLQTTAKKLRKKWAATQRPVWIAASTHANEDEQILAAFKQVKIALPQALLILVPRHPERFASVTLLAKNSGFATISYKNQEPCNAATDVIIGDIIGELMLLYATADVAFVGGSLVPTGGHNLLEPAALSIPIITGPHLDNFRDISKLLTTANALTIVHDAPELAEQTLQLLQNQILRERQGHAGLNVVAQNQGALQKILDLIAQHM